MSKFNSAIRIDPSKFSIGDIEFLMEATGKDSLEEIFEGFGGEGNRVTIELLNTVANLVYVSQRKANPDFTLEDAKEVSIDEFQKAMVTEDGEEGKAGQLPLEG